MASSSTEADGPAGRAAPPDPLDAASLRSVPGVLGEIVRERSADYHDMPLPGPAIARLARPAFATALSRPGVSVIAEVKRSSPSQGHIRQLDPVAVARAYAQAGAAAVSVLTESRHFGGELAHLRAVAEAVRLPLLRKDFVVHPAQLAEASAAGASAALLIAAVLGDALPAYLSYAAGIGLECLVEVHDRAQLAQAMSAGARVIGVNNRDLRSLDVDLSLAPRLLRAARGAGYEGLLVAESGYRERRQLEALAGLADAVLVGTSLAASDDPGPALAALLAPAGGRAGGAP